MFQFFDEHPNNPPIGDADGEVWYEFNGRGYAGQLFSAISTGRTSGDRNIWKWDGDRREPTLTPSFLLPDFRLHLYVRKGKLDILPDTTVDCSSYRRMEWDEFFRVTE